MSETIEIPGTPDEITSTWLTGALRSSKIAASLNGNTKVASLTVEPLSGAGYLGQIIRLRPVYDRPAKHLPETFIVKLPHPDPEMRQNIFWTCEREIFFYRELAHKVSLTTPVCYFYAMDAEEFKAILLLEDLARLRMVDLAQGCGLEDAQTVIALFARLHAQWWQNPWLVEMETYIKPVNERWMENQEEIYTDRWSRFEENITALLPNIYVPASFLKMGERASSQMLDLFDELAAEPFTFLHGDTHLDNLMFAASSDDPALTVLDWQLLAYGPGICNISYFLILCLPVRLRREIERDLLQDYHARLVEHGVTEYTFEQCWRAYRLSFFRLLDVIVILVDGFDMTGDHGKAMIVACFARIASFAEDHRVEEFLR